MPVRERGKPVATPTLTHPTYNLDALRAEFKVTANGITYLNHAGISPLPTSVTQAVSDVTEAISQSGSDGYHAFDYLFTDLPEQIGKLVDVESEQVTFVQNTSMGLNLIAQSLPLQAGDNILLCDVEFPSNVYSWMNLARKGVETRLVPAKDGGLTLETLDAARDGRSRVVAVSAVQFFTGRHEDLVALGQYCDEHDLWLIVDAIQAAGVVPIDMQAMRIDAVVAGGQKALLAPPGQGFMALRPELLEVLEPVFVGPLSVVGWEHWLHYDMTPNPGARRFDMGTSNLSGMAGLFAAVKLLMSLGVENINRWVTHLGDLAMADLTERGCRVITPERHAHIVTFAPKGDANQLAEQLQARGIMISARQDAGGAPHLRISAHCYNTEEEILRVGKMLSELEG
jgi:cysteine desulfurase/selenocysteine lyase